MVQNLTSMQSSRLSIWELGFRISDCVVTFVTSQIPNPNSQIEFTVAWAVPASHRLPSHTIVYCCSLLVVRSLLGVGSCSDERTTIHEQRTTNEPIKKQLLLLPSRLPDLHPAALARRKLQRDFLLSAHPLMSRSRRPFHLSAA